MNTRTIALGILIGAAGLQAISAQAQPSAGSQEAQIFAGYLFGDRLTKGPISGETPRLNDNGYYGARYTYHFTDQWGLQISAGHSPNRAAHVMSGDTNMGVTTVDVDAEWDPLRNLTLAGHPIVPYAVIGAGYAWSNLDRSIVGTVGSTAQTLNDANGYTANAGLGVKFFLSDNVFVDFGGRHRYFNKLVSTDSQGLNTAETSLGIGYRF